MEYTPELFKEDKEPSFNTKYRYELSGAFYDVYSDSDNDYHMAIEDMDSLLERIHFYTHYISILRYPVYTTMYGQRYETASNPEVLYQVLGLPLSVMSRIDKDKNRVPLTCDEILNRIHFENGLYQKEETQNTFTEAVLESTSMPVIEAINYLIANGVFCLNPERALHDPALESEMFYPIFIDETKLPESFKAVNEDSDKMLMDFADKIYLLNKDDYLRTFKRLDNMTISQKAAIAFGPFKPLNQADFVFQMTLRNYFFALIRGLLNDFFFKRYNVKHLFKGSVLDHDLETTNIRTRFAYFGTPFFMTTSDYRVFKKKDDQVTEEFIPTNYQFSLEEKNRIETAFIGTKAYFLKHPQLGFVPSIFLKMMGLPYPAFETARFFDFEHGDSKHFLDLFTFYEGRSFKQSGIVTFFAETNGTLFLPETGYNPLFYTKIKLADEGFFVYNRTTVYEARQHFYSAHYEGKDPKILALFTGDTDTYKKGLDESEKISYETSPLGADFANLRTFISQDDSDGHLATVRKYFDLLNQGYSSKEAESLVSIEPKINVNSFHELIDFAIHYLFSKDIEHFFSSITNLHDRKIFQLVSEGEEFNDPYLPIPQVYKGRLFLTYKDKDGSFYFDSKDQEALTNLHKIFRRFFLASGSFLYSISLYDSEYLYRFAFQPCTDYSVEALFLGIHLEVLSTLDLSKDLISQLKFKDNISLFDQPKQEEVLHFDQSLALMLVFRESLNRGVYILGRENTNRPFYSLREKADDNLRLYFSPDFIKLCLKEEEIKTSLNPANIEAIIQMSDSDFRSSFSDYAYGMRNFYEPKKGLDKGIADIASDYAGHLNRSFYQMVYHSFFHDEEKSRHYLVSYPHVINGTLYYVSPGPLFFAFSKSKDINTFYLLKDDEEGLLFALNATIKKYSYLKTKKERARMETNELGLPVCFMEPFYRLLCNSSHPSKKEIEKLFQFKDEHLPLNDLPSFKDPLRTVNPTFDNLLSSTQLKNKALHQGFFMASATDMFDSELDDDQKLANNLTSNLIYLESFLVKVSDNPTGDVKQILLSSGLVYSNYLTEFIQEYSKTSLKPDFLFYASEALQYANHEDDHFIVKVINLLQGENQEKFFTYVEKLFRNFRLKEFRKTIPMDFIYGIVALFALNLEQILVYRISKGMRS
jgi:hypothetical protein